MGIPNSQSRIGIFISPSVMSLRAGSTHRPAQNYCLSNSLATQAETLKARAAKRLPHCCTEPSMCDQKNKMTQ